MRDGFGWDFSAVRVHDDSSGARLATNAHAHAATFGTHIAFAPGQYRPQSRDGEQLIAHELAHVLQQQRTGPTLQLQGDGTHGLGSVLTVNWDVHFQQNHPTATELGADASAVLTPAGIGDLTMVQRMLLNDPLMQAQLEGSASVEGQPADNLSLSSRRAQWIGRHIGIFRVHDAPGHPSDCAPGVISGEYACGSTHASAAVDPNDRRVTVRMFRPPGTLATPPTSPTTPGTTPTTPGTTPTTPGTTPTTPGTTPTTPGTTPTTPGMTPTTPGTAPGTTTAPPTSGNQFGLQGGIGYTRHFYTTGATPRDPLREWVVQVVAGYTHQFHGKDQSGFELQLPIQAQYSLTTRQWTIVGGAQLSYAIALPANLQASFFAQLVGGGNVTAGGYQIQPALGAQFQWQPVDWLSLAAQLSPGYTGGIGGPSSFDLGGVFVITIQR
jgi:outer membrane protein OmpA-like peptidoglycan-associated protein